MNHTAIRGLVTNTILNPSGVARSGLVSKAWKLFNIVKPSVSFRASKLLLLKGDQKFFLPSGSFRIRLWRFQVASWPRRIRQIHGQRLLWLCWEFYLYELMPKSVCLNVSYTWWQYWRYEHLLFPNPFSSLLWLEVASYNAEWLQWQLYDIEYCQPW